MTGLRIGSLFSGYAGLDRAAEEAFGATTAWVSDIDPGACKILAHRYPDLPNHGDITKIDWQAVEPVDILTGGFPCQDLSHAGKRAGLKGGTRSGLWSYMAEAIDQLRPRYVVAENVRGLLSACAHSDLEPCPRCVGGAGKHQPVLRALGRVLGDLADIGGYDVRWTGIRAADVGAPHNRFRVFVLATNTDSLGRERGWRTRDGRPGLADHDLAAADTLSGGWERRGSDELAGASVDAAGDGEGAVLAAADTQGDGRDERRSEPARVVGGPDAAERGASLAANPSGERHGRGQDRREVGRVDGGAEGEARQRQRARAESGDRGAEVAADAEGIRRREQQPGGAGAQLTGPALNRAIDWGQYEPAIRRWERVLGRVAPAPTETSPKGSQRLSPRFVEWLMGLPAGWVTDVPDLNRNAQLKALGNGVVSQQCYAALIHMLEVSEYAQAV